MLLQVVGKAAEFVAARRVLEFAQGLGFDLADAFAGDAEFLSHFFKRVRYAVEESVAKLENLTLFFRKVAEDFFHLVA